MTILSAVVGWAAPNLVSIWMLCGFTFSSWVTELSLVSCQLHEDISFIEMGFHLFSEMMQISRKLTHHITTLLFFAFGLWSLWDAFTGEG